GAIGTGAGRGTVDAGHRSGPPGAARRGGTGAGRGQPRRQVQDARRHCRPAPARQRAGPRRGETLPPGALIEALSTLYGAAAAWRRSWYARDPLRQRRLARPVVSVGNLRVGGSGKTPVVEYVARMLVAAGERPAILTRGYARRIAHDGVTIVSDG